MARNLLNQAAEGEEMKIMAKRRALCLAGGGVLGAAYEIGALAAVEDHFASTSIHDEWDVLVGCSAGAVVASFLAQGVSARTLYEYFSVADIGPSVLGERKFRINRFEHALRRIFLDLGLSNRFADLRRTLLIPAVDVDDSEREVFGSRPSEPTTVTEAVAASCAIPPVFSPFTIGRRRFVDGAFGSPLPVDLAVAAGASHILAVDPIAPVRNTSARRSDRGIFAQCKRIEHASRSMLALAYARLMAPHVRTLLLRPARREMYGQNPMDWTGASALLKLGREQTARQLQAADVRTFLREAIGMRGPRVGLSFRAAEAASA